MMLKMIMMKDAGVLTHRGRKYSFCIFADRFFFFVFSICLFVYCCDETLFFSYRKRSKREANNDLRWTSSHLVSFFSYRRVLFEQRSSLTKTFDFLVFFIEKIEKKKPCQPIFWQGQTRMNFIVILISWIIRSTDANCEQISRWEKKTTNNYSFIHQTPAKTPTICQLSWRFFQIIVRVPAWIWWDVKKIYSRNMSCLLTQSYLGTFCNQPCLV